MTTSDTPVTGANPTKHAGHTAGAAHVPPKPFDQPETNSPALAYATPWPRRKYVPSPEANRLFWMGVRKLVFAGGIGLTMWGLACLVAGVERHSAPLAIGWGVMFIVLMLPFSLRRQPRNRRRKYRHRRATAPLSGVAPRPAHSEKAIAKTRPDQEHVA